MKKNIFVIIWLLLLLNSNVFGNELKLINKNTHFETLQGINLHKDIKIALKLNDKSINNQKIFIRLVSKPNKSKIIIDEIMKTDQIGKINYNFPIPDKAGEYTLMFQYENNNVKPVFVTIKVRKRFWIIFLIFGLIGGLGLFLYGMDFMGKGLQKWAGTKMQSILALLTKNVFIAILLGIIVTAVIQSSSATTVMIVGFTNVGLMTLKQTLGVILGAGIGTTVTSQLVAFKLTKYALLFVGVGFFTFFFSKKKSMIYFGQVLLGFGLLFLGLKLMSDTMYPLREHPFFKDLLSKAENPYIAILISVIFTSIVQSSSATTGLVVAMAADGLITLRMGIPLIFGANIGTCITAGLASIGASRESKRVAIFNYLFKIVGVLMFLPFIDMFAKFNEQFTDSIPRQIANAHTFFNIIVVTVFIPFLSLFEKVIYKILPKQKAKDDVLKPKYINDELLADPEIALKQTRKEILRIFDIVGEMIDDSFDVFKNKKTEELEKLIEKDENVDVLYRIIKSYLASIPHEEMSSKQTLFLTQLVYSVEEIEKIGDSISKNIAHTLNKIIQKQMKFHEGDFEHIMSFYEKVKENFIKTQKAFVSNDYSSAKKLIDDRKSLQILFKALQISHLQKFQKNYDVTIKYSSEYLSLLSDYRDIFYMITNITYTITEYYQELEWLKEK